MAQHKAKNSATQKDLSEPGVAGNEEKDDHPVGYCHPPAQYQFQPGKSGNPGGRPKGRPDVKAEIERIFSKSVTVRDGKGKHQMSLIAANLLAQGAKGLNGDTRSTGLLFNVAHKMGFLSQEDITAIDDTMSGGGQDRVLIAPANKTGPSDGLFENLNLELLSRDEVLELSRLAAIIDLGGDITALSATDFERIKHIVNKGRGKDVTPKSDLPSRKTS